MTVRDRLVVMGLGLLVVLALGWFMLIAPERKTASEAAAAVNTAKQALASAREDAVNAQSAQHTYDASYATVVSLGLALPSSSEVPSLMYQLEKASNAGRVVFTSISTGGATTAGVPTSATGAPSGFSSLPFTFVFEGDYAGLDHLLDEIDNVAVPTPSGVPKVTGRLLTVQGVDISGGTGGPKAGLTATVTATAYTLAGGLPVAAGATAEGPASASSSEEGESSTVEGSPSAPAVIKGLW